MRESYYRTSEIPNFWPNLRFLEGPGWNFLCRLVKCRQWYGCTDEMQYTQGSATTSLSVRSQEYTAQEYTLYTLHYTGTLTDCLPETHQEPLEFKGNTVPLK